MVPLFDGVAALLGMLTSCASGVSVVNIDNGFGCRFSGEIPSIVCRIVFSDLLSMSRHMQSAIAEKYNALKQHLSQYESVIIAFFRGH